MLTEVVVHADWSGSKPKKCVAATARLAPDDHYRIDAPQAVGRTGSWRERLRVPTGTSGTVLIGFDFPIGIPGAYANKVGISSFRDALPQFGEGVWRDFYDVCKKPAEISLHRPFYPNSCPVAGMCTHEHLTTALGIEWDDLFRQCEQKTADRRVACPLFWTLGGNQVGKSACSGWRSAVLPMLSEGHHVGLWPFDAPLVELLQSRSYVIVETYPTEFYGHLGVRLPHPEKGGKTKRPAREHYAEQLLAEAAGLDVELSVAACHSITSGFGSSSDGEDHFDAMVGLLGILKHLHSAANVEPPPDHAVNSVEGWMLGQKPAPVSPSSATSSAP